MGWKTIKQHYRIEHTVHIVGGNLCIGSPYISVIIEVLPDGTFKKRYDDRGNDDLARYQSEIAADPAKFRELFSAPDQFEHAIVVYTYSEGEIIEQKCEKLGWPNATHDGQIMYQNTHTTDRAVAIKWAKLDAEIAVKWAQEHIDRLDAELSERRVKLTTVEGWLAKAKLL